MPDKKQNANERTVYRSTGFAKGKPPRRTWRDTPERTIRGFDRLPKAESLHPGLRTTEAAVAGSPRAKAIITAWRPCLAWQSLITVVAA